MHIKRHPDGRGQTITAACDENLIGTTLDGETLHITVSEHFYKGEKKTREEAATILKTATNLNLLGKETIQLCLDLNIIQKEHILMIGNVPHAIVLAL